MSLSFGPLTRRTLHLCIDMQNVFAEPTPWHAPWMARVLPVVEEIAGGTPGRPYSLALFHPQGPKICQARGNGISAIGKR